MCNAGKLSVVGWLLLVLCSDGIASTTVTVPQSAELHAYLLRNSFIYGLAATGERNANTDCALQLRQWRAGVLKRRAWALKMLDASGSRPSGFMFGHNYWVGSRETCTAAQHAVPITLSKYAPNVMQPGLLTETAPFDVDLRVAYLRHNSSWQTAYPFFFHTPLIHVGLCVPSACALPEIGQRLAHYVASELFTATDIFDMRPQVAYVKAPKCAWNLQPSLGLALVAAFLVFTAAMISAAWLLRNQGKAAATTTAQRTLQKSEKANGANEANVRTSKDTNGVFEQLGSVVACFDIKSNWQQMFALHECTTSEIPVINGIRTLSAVSVVLIHLLVLVYNAVPNTAEVFRYFDAFKYLALSVDAFFTISGFLRTYHFLSGKQLQVVRRNNFTANAKLFCFEIFHRYLRLMPLNAILIGGLSLGFNAIHSTTTVHIHTHIGKICAQSWWRNALFIHNFSAFEEVCGVWTWSLACEMQYYVLATILLFIYAKHPRLAKCGIVVLLAVNALWTVRTSGNVNFQVTLDSLIINTTEVYFNSVVRILPYIVGAVAGGFLAANRSTTDMSNGKASLWSTAVVAVGLASLVVYLKQTDSVLRATLLYFGARLGVALTVCWLVIGSAAGSDIWWLRVLEAKVFQHFGRVCFAMSLLNPIVLGLTVPMASGLLYVDPFILSVLFIGFLFLIYAASVLCSLIFEMPYCHWSRLMLRRRRANT